jgi:zinc/manganese transport system substrate-binding protein
MEQAGICTIFAESTANIDLAGTVTAELNACASVEVVPLYTGSIGPFGSGADSYIDMMEANIEAIVAGVQ